MDLREAKEAKNALLEVRDEVDKILEVVNSAKGLSIADMFLDSMFLSFLKRDKIKDINEDLKKLKEKIEIAKKELSDIDINFSGEISDTNWDNFFDIFFDNIFTDLRVNSEINDMKDNLTDLRDKIDEILKKL